MSVGEVNDIIQGILRDEAAELFAVVQQVLHLLAFLRRSIEGGLFQLVVADRQLEPVAELLELLDIELLLLVRVKS